MSRLDYTISQQKETQLTIDISKKLLDNGFNSGNTVVVTVSTDYSSNVGQFIRHYLTSEGEICFGFGVDVPYPDQTWDETFLNELDTIFELYKNSFKNKRVLLVEAGVIRGSNYYFLVDYIKNNYGIDAYTLALFENKSSKFKSNFVGEYYDDDTQDLTFWWEKQNNHWKV